jgi:Uma2 family endonuclease
MSYAPRSAPNQQTPASVKAAAPIRLLPFSRIEAQCLSACRPLPILGDTDDPEHDDAMTLPLHDVRRHTYGEYLTWPEGERYELIDGVGYAMAPAPSRGHQRLVGELYRQIADALEGGPCEVNVAPFDVRLPEKDEADEADEAIATVVQPDIAVVCDPAKLDERGCRGAPDWIVEVLSPSSAGHDQIRKLALYERQGVREYWLAHPGDRIVTVYQLENGAYGRPVVTEMQDRLASSSCPGVEIDWERVVKGLP